MPLLELAHLCHRRKEELLESWKDKNTQHIIDLVTESRVIYRVLDSISDARNTTFVQSQLDHLGDSRLKDVFSYFYRRTMRTYKRVLRQWRLSD